MIKWIQHLLSSTDEGRKWIDDLKIDGRTLEFYAPYENESDIYHFKIGDILRDTYTDNDYRAIDKIKKKSRWGEERDVFILKSLKSSDQFGLEHSPEGFGGLRYHKKYRITFSQEEWVGYLPLRDLFDSTVRMDQTKSILPAQPGILLLYDQQYHLQYMEKTRNIHETAYDYFVRDEETAIHSIRPLFDLLCYIKKRDDEERSALFYFLRHRLKPKWDKHALHHRSESHVSPRLDRYKQILRLSLTVEDLLNYIQEKQPDESVNLEEVQAIARYMETLKEKEQIEEIIELVIQKCLEQYQKKKTKDVVRNP